MVQRLTGAINREWTQCVLILFQWQYSNYLCAYIKERDEWFILAMNKSKKRCLNSSYSSVKVIYWDDLKFELFTDFINRRSKNYYNLVVMLDVAKVTLFGFRINVAMERFYIHHDCFTCSTWSEPIMTHWINGEVYRSSDADFRDFFRREY